MEQSAIVKLTSNFLHLIKHTRETEEERDPVHSPLSRMSKMAGQLILHHLNARPRLVIVFSNTSFLFYYPALLTVHSFLTDGFIDSSLEDSEITGHVDTAVNCSSYISTYISMYAWSCPFTGGYLQGLLRLLTDIDYMQTNVFVKLTLSCNHIKKSGLTKYGDFPCLEQRRRIMT